MAVGSVADLTSRLQRWLPARWFPTQAVNADGSVPRVYAQLVSWATGLASVFNLIAYLKLQARLASSTDGFLDLMSQDLFGGNLPRILGETDPAFFARIKANLFVPANTRAALLQAVEQVTCFNAQIIEPWQPNDTFCWNRSFWNVNLPGIGGQWANGNQRCAVLIRCSLPASAGAGGMPRMGWNNFFWGSGLTNAVALGAWWTAFNAGNGANLVYAAINRARAAGVSVYVQFVPPSALATQTHSVLTLPDGSPLTTPDGTELTT